MTRAPWRLTGRIQVGLPPGQAHEPGTLVYAATEVDWLTLQTGTGVWA